MPPTLMDLCTLHQSDIVLDMWMSWATCGELSNMQMSGAVWELANMYINKMRDM